MKTAKPRIPSPFTVGILQPVYYPPAQIHMNTKTRLQSLDTGIQLQNGQIRSPLLPFAPLERNQGSQCS